MNKRRFVIQIMKVESFHFQREIIRMVGGFNVFKRLGHDILFGGLLSERHRLVNITVQVDRFLYFHILSVDRDGYIPPCAVHFLAFNGPGVAASDAFDRLCVFSYRDKNRVKIVAKVVVADFLDIDGKLKLLLRGAPVGPELDKIQVVLGEGRIVFHLKIPGAFVKHVALQKAHVVGVVGVADGLFRGDVSVKAADDVCGFADVENLLRISGHLAVVVLNRRLEPGKPGLLLFAFSGRNVKTVLQVSERLGGCNGRLLIDIHRNLADRPAEQAVFSLASGVGCVEENRQDGFGFPEIVIVRVLGANREFQGSDLSHFHGAAAVVNHRIILFGHGCVDAVASPDLRSRAPGCAGFSRVNSYNHPETASLTGSRL